MDPVRSKVAVVRAPTYAQAEGAVTQALDLLGGLEQLIPRGARVFVKINHLSPPSPPERGIVTHPRFTEAVLKLLLTRTPHIGVGDDVYANHDEDPFEISGYRDLCTRMGVQLVNLREEGFVRVTCSGARLREVFVGKALREADVVVNLPKLKTHSLTVLTGAIKNMYGTIPRGLRVNFHGQYNDPHEFSQVLVDIFSVTQPRLTIMDAIEAMEGAGPADGVVRPLGLILASTDAVAVDAVASHIVGLDPLKLGTTAEAHRRGLGQGDLTHIDVVGEPLSAVRATHFRLPSLPAGEIVGFFPRALTRFVARQLVVQPMVNRKKCVACRACVEMCPTGAAHMFEGKARISPAICVRCMCCHEACRFGAIVLTHPGLGKVVHPLAHLARGRRLKK